MHLLHLLLERAAESGPEHAAVVSDRAACTYAELNSEANRLSQRLRGLGVQRGDRVGIYLDKSVEAVLGIYGILKCGAAYVPLDPHAPAGRIGYIASDCGISTLVTGTEMAERWPELVAMGAPVRDFVVLNAGSGDAPPVPDGTALVTRDELAGLPDSPAEHRTIDRDLAYILYTSGSTGRPKGVMLSHANAIAFASWAATEFGLHHGDRVSQFAPLIFDLSTFDLFATALAGASLHLVSHQTTLFPTSVRKLLEQQRITVIYAVPSLLTMLLERSGIEPGAFPDLRLVLFAGEVFPSKHLGQLMRVLPQATFANLYGPTETNVCTSFVVPEPPDAQDPPVSIGRAITNDETLVVLDDGTPAAVGETGELYVRGATVMQGYWGDAERTAASLVPNPFDAHLTDPVYKTGDLVVEQADGNYLLVGRRDNQIKRRGYRIELGDIETALYAHSAVRECAVVALSREGVVDRLVACVAAEGVDHIELAAFVLERIPRYMLPDEFRIVAELPKTPTGKIDRYALATSSEEHNGHD